MSIDNVTDVNPRVQYVASAAQTAFDYPFPIFQDADLVVDVDGVTKTLTTHYTVTGAGADTGGTVTFLSAMTGGEIVTIYRDISIARTTDYQQNGPWTSTALNDELDRMTLVDQQLESRVLRALRIPITAEVADADIELDPATWGNKYITLDVNGKPTPALLSSTTMTQALIGQLLYPRTAAEIATEVFPVNYHIPPYPINPLRYGNNTTPGTTDMTSAFQAAINVSEAAGNATIVPSDGVYYIAGTLTCNQGTAIVGLGSQGSNQSYGFVIIHGGAAVDCLVWDGNGTAFAGTGGGLRNCLLVKKAGVAGGRAINVTATSDNFRPGEMVFDNVLIYGLDATALWSKAIYVDGTACNTPGAKGVRSLTFRKVRVADCSTNNQYVHLKQVTHVYGDIQMDTGNGTGTLGMTIDDDWDHINLYALRVGNIVVNYTGADNPTLNLSGECASLDINHANILGVCPIKATNGITSAASLSRIASTTVDNFTAFVSATVGNTTGDGTSYTIIFDTESYDNNASYDNATGIWTVKCAGIADLDWGTVLTSLGAAHTTGELTLDHRDSGGSSRNQISTKYGVGPMRDAANQCGIHNHIKLRVFEGDTLKVLIAVSGSTKTVGVAGAATRYSYFSGKILA